MSGSTNKTVGIIANPYSSRDIRRLISSATSIQTVERANIVERVLVTLSQFGISKAYMMPDKSGLSAHLIRNLKSKHAFKKLNGIELDFLDMPITSTVEDTYAACELFKELNVSAILILGGDGTHKAVASKITNVPLVSISTGTNNAFPKFYEATLVGMALGLYLSDSIDKAHIVQNNKMIHVTINDEERDIALVDIAISNENWIGARALWKTEQLNELYLAFCEPTAIGISSIGGLLNPVSRNDSHGLKINLAVDNNGKIKINAPIAPGLFETIHISDYSHLEFNKAYPIQTPKGVIALDGEREIEFNKNDIVSILLNNDGPITLNIEKTLQLAAAEGVFVERTHSFNADFMDTYFERNMCLV